MESNPRTIFERLFGDADVSDPAAPVRALQADRSVLDSVRESLGRLQKGIGASDRARVAEYVEAIRSVERRIQEAEKRTLDVPDASALAPPSVTFVERYTLMLDLMALAFHADLTRVCTLMVGCEASVQTYAEIGVREAHHQISHHQERSREAGQAHRHQHPAHEAARLFPRAAPIHVRGRRRVAR